MTDFTPEIRVMTLPPNTDHSATMTEVTAMVNYSINISRGTSEYISAPYPAQTTLTLLFDEDVIPDIELGSWVQIECRNSIGAWAVLQAGNVTNRTSQYRSYGLTGYVLEWQFSITSTISLLQNTAFYVDQDAQQGTDGWISDIENLSKLFQWDNLNRNLTWANYGPDAWDEVDTFRDIDFPIFNIGTNTYNQQLNEGYHNTWDELVKLVYGVYGYIVENPDGELFFRFGEVTLTSAITLTADMLSPDIEGGDRFDTMRNRVTLSKYDSTQTTYYGSDSIALYGDRLGSLDTYLVDQPDLNDTGQKILNSMSYPLLSTERVSVNLLNPIFTDAQRDDFFLSIPLGCRISVEAPQAMGGTQEYLTIGCNYTINRNEFVMDLTLAPFAQAYNTPNWDQIDYSYTWTSYGVAFPTQKWQDL
jgi:hypothetical protein